MRVRGEVAAGVVAHQQHRALLRDVLEPAHVGAEVEARQHPEAGQRLADVVGVALVEVRSRHAPLSLLGHRGDQPARHLRERRRGAHRARRGARRRLGAGPVGRLARGLGGHAARRAAGRISGQLDGGPCGRLILCGSPAGRPARRRAHARARAAARPPCARRSRSRAGAAPRSSSCGPSPHGPPRSARLSRTSVPKRRTLRSSRSSRPREARRVSAGIRSRTAPTPELPSALLVSGLRQITRSSPRPGNEVQVRHRADAAVHVAAPADLHGPEEAGDGA